MLRKSNVKLQAGERSVEDLEGVPGLTLSLPPALRHSGQGGRDSRACHDSGSGKYIMQQSTKIRRSVNEGGRRGAEMTITQRRLSQDPDSIDLSGNDPNIYFCTRVRAWGESV